MFPPVDKDRGFPERELDVLRFWKERNVYQQTLDARDGAPPFVFFEGPPTANGMPHPGHCLTRSIKDLYPRYKTMRGYRCERKAGWDTHGLPVEVEVCKELGIHSKEEIENFGIEPFIQKCQASVWRYMNEWERLTERLGFWVDLKHAYVTYHQSFIESVWWSLKNLFDRGLLYKGHKIVWWWAQGGTALSSGEVGQGYREVADPSVFVKFPLLDKDGEPTDESLLVWTTTPWTLPSNQFVAVNSAIKYVTAIDEESGEKFVVAAELLGTLADKTKRKLRADTSPVDGAGLIGERYIPPFECYRDKYDTMAQLANGGSSYTSWRIVAADFVTTESGTGLVHIAPAFGEADFEVLEDERSQFNNDTEPLLLNAVGPDGKFTDEAPEFVRGRWVKDCDKDITRDLKSRGLLFHQEQYLHDYPFCWRAEEDPLIQYPRESWFIRTTSVKEAMIENNSKINWLPDHIRDGRFGKFLESNVDWALSRERFWGTPLPIWVCNKTGKKEAIGSYEELLDKPGVRGTEVWNNSKRANPNLVDDLRVHKPYIDAITYECSSTCDCKGTGRKERVSEVIDCWYDSGAMPFAQWGYRGEEGPSQARDRFSSQFPADFISEAIDQTRGWFYSQLAISTLLWGKQSSHESMLAKVVEKVTGKDNVVPYRETKTVPYPHPFKNCIVLGLMLGEDGQKMSKSKRNYREPNEIFDKYGADALRWYFFANQPPWTSIRYSEQSIKDSVPEFLLRLWNVYSFFTIYANIDGFSPVGSGNSSSAGTPRVPGAAPKRLLAQRSELDRWILSELNRTAAIVVERMDAYDNFAACGAITEFVDALSNWYVRRSRDRFWAADKQSAEKLDAYWTLYECLTTTAQLIAPFTPFLAESLWQNLVAKPLSGGKAGGAPESVHLCDYPTGDASAIDEQLSARMNLVRHISSLGRQARTSASLKVRQPLARVEVILADNTHQKWLEEHAAVIAEELNVKLVEFSDEPDKYVEHEVLPNFKLLGKKLGKLMPKIKPALASQSGAELLANLRDNGKVDLVIDGEAVQLLPEELEIRFKAKPGWTAANDKGVVVVLATEVTPELLAEGLARDLVRVIQDRRKETGCEFTDRIEVGVVTDSPELRAAVEMFSEYIAAETLAVRVTPAPIQGVEPVKVTIGDYSADVYIRVVK
ncbi:isoleucine--tRNA ligase [Lacipirellula limnantheis]|uniref:Isoleucine--tRNA ligase n=1 Tax=Lacipirellula limnantheis TaxID=2528024 RepID=A0A517TXA1_9BACT|nr:class I tRNA ligase family protein [Lacipirellula limnantheis]QDT72998.1 Isoleucine--tRNA ligase [Lacipirellula limnantheis]